MAWITDDISGIIGIICLCGFIGVVLYFILISGVGIDIWTYVMSGFGYVFNQHNATAIVTGVI